MHTVELEDNGVIAVVGTVEPVGTRYRAITPAGKPLRVTYSSVELAGEALVSLWMTCAWAAACTNPVTTSVPHPVLGSVRACDRCARLATGRPA